MKKKKKISSFIYYMFSYIVICLIPLGIMGSILLSNTVRIVQNEAEKSNIYRMDQARLIIEERIRSLKHTAMQISQDSNITKAFFAGMHMYDRMRLSQKLNEYKSYNLIIDDIFVYYIQQDVVLTTVDLSKAEDIKSIINIYDGRKWEDIIHDINSSFNHPLVKVTWKNKFHKEMNAGVALFFPIPAYSNNPDSLIIIIVNEFRFAQLIHDTTNHHNISAFILDDKDRLIVSSMNNFPLNRVNFAQLVDNREDRSIHETFIGRERFSVASVRSKVYGFSCLIAMPSKQFWVYVLAIRQTILQVLVIAASIGILLSLILARSANSIIKKLVSLFSYLNEFSAAENGYNEFDIVIASAREVTKRNQEMARCLDEQKEIVEN